jgi:hypothetical protein
MWTFGAPRYLWFALRNFEMDLLRLVDLDNETTVSARSMATASSVIRWHCKLNARHVEFCARRTANRDIISRQQCHDWKSWKRLAHYRHIKKQDIQ